MDTLALFLVLSAAVLVTALARRFGGPAPLLIVGLALAVSYLPGIPTFTLDPELILTVVLPPLLYASALEVSLVSFREVSSSIWRLGVGLVAVSAVLVGVVVFILVPDMTLPVALLVGAIVAPPDAVSAVAIGRKVGLPRRVMSILTGESLVNDASSLTIFKVSLAVVGGAALTWSEDLGIFVAAVVIGVAVGSVVALTFLWLRRLFPDPPVQVLFGLMLPFFVYVGAEHVAGSGVLAVVTAGLIVGFNAPKSDYQLRLQERPVWDAVNLLLEGFVFAIIGLQFHSVIHSIAAGDRGMGWSLGIAALALLACVLTRFAFVFVTSLVGNVRARYRERSRLVLANDDAALVGFPAWRRRRLRDRRGEVILSWQEMFVISWSGMRGVVTVAAAVSVPAVTASGVAVPAHDLIVLIAFVVTVGSLLLQGLTLPMLARRLGVVEAGQKERDHAAKTRFLYDSLNEAASSVLDDARRDPNRFPGIGLEVISAIQARIQSSEHRDDAVAVDADAAQGGGTTQRDVAKSREALILIRREVLARRRAILARERNAGTIDEELVSEILLVFDADELVLDNQGY